MNEMSCMQFMESGLGIDDAIKYSTTAESFLAKLKCFYSCSTSNIIYYLKNLRVMIQHEIVVYEDLYERGIDHLAKNISIKEKHLKLIDEVLKLLAV